MRQLSPLVVTLGFILWACGCTTVQVTVAPTPQQPVQTAQAPPQQATGTAPATPAPQPTQAYQAPQAQPAAQTVTVEQKGHGVVHKLLFYIPNRVLDAVDIVRLRARVGPGLALGARATQVFSGYLGSYATIYAGLPGPRGKPTVKLPIGLESYNGIGVSVANATVSGGIGPDYGFTEFGVSAQLLIVGFDVGIDPWEIVDFATGLATVDPVGDDL